MSKVTITDIRKVSKGEMDISDLNLKVKKYITMGNKSDVMQKVLSVCLDEVEGMTSVNYILKTLMTDIGILRKYTNIDFSTVDKIEEFDKWNDKLIELYDILKETGIVEFVYSNIPMHEKYELLDLIDNEVEQEVRIQSSTTLAINKGVGKIASEVGKLIDSMPKDKKELAKMIEILKGNFIK